MTHPFKLKHLSRAGWLRVGISSPESVASHSWGVGYLALITAPADLDIQKLLAMALIHDLPEIIVGDITPHDGITTQEKHAQEEAAAHRILDNKAFTLWKEYQQKKTPEAQYLSLLDKVDMALQAQIYGSSFNTNEFLDSFHKYIKHYEDNLGPIPKSLNDLLCKYKLKQ